MLALSIGSQPTPASAAAEQAASTVVEPTPIEVESYANEFSVSEQTAARNLKAQQHGIGIGENLERALGKGYAGVWFDNEAGEFVVPVLAESDKESIAALGAAKLNGDFRTTPAQSSWKELESAQAEVNSALTAMFEEGLVASAIDPRTNSVVIYSSTAASPSDRSEIQAQVEQVAHQSKVNLEEKLRDSNEFKASPLACAAYSYSWGTVRVCDRPLRGGVYIEPSAGTGGHCSAGFKAIGNIYGNRFLLTAGHCVREYADWRSFDSEEYPHYIGHVEAAYYPDHDYAAVRVKSDTYWEGAPWPSVVAYWGGSQNIPIEHESGSYVGESVCRSGTENVGCGTVTNVDVSEAYYQNGTYDGTVNHLVEAYGTNAIPGDSGGPVWTGNTALGLVSGGNQTYNKMFYSQITEDTADLGVTVGTQVGAPPFVETNTASSIQAYQATGNGKVDPNGLSTSYHFEYGTTTAYGSSTESVNAGSGWSTSTISVTLSSLIAATTYHYRLVASNSSGTSYGADQQFTTLTAPPVVTVEEPSGMVGGNATLRGTVNPEGESTSYRYEWNVLGGYPYRWPELREESAGNGTAPVGVQHTVTGLTGKRQYYYRIVSHNNKGPAEAERTFETPDWSPKVTTEGNEEVAIKTYKLKAKVNPHGFSTSYGFEYGTTTAYGSKIESKTQLTGTTEQEVSLNIEGLKGETTYHYRVFATNEGNGSSVTNHGEDKSLTTPNWRPGITAESLSGITARGTTFHASINPRGLDTHYEFQYGPTTSYGASAPVPSADIGSGASAVQVSQTITGLSSTATYHYRVVATNSEGATATTDALFTTAAPPPPVYASQFGKEGSGGGQLKHPGEMARDAKGNLWVADRSNNRVEEFNPAGEFILTFGKEVNKTKVESGGTEAEKNLCTAASGNTCQAAKAGSGNGQFEWMSGLDIDANGHIWVADEELNRVQEFNEAGEFLLKFGSSGTANGQFRSPEGIAVDAKGNLWVADRLNNRIQEFNSAGEFQKAIGSGGSGAGQFWGPDAVAVAPNGSLWVTDRPNSRIEEFNPAGEFVLAAGKEVNATTGADLCTAASGNTCQAGKEAAGEGQFKGPDGIEADSGSHIWVADQGNQRVEELSEGARFIGSFGSSGSGEGQLNLGVPVGIATDTAGDVWVADLGNNRVQRWIASNYATYSSSFGKEGTAAGQFKHPGDVSLDPKGNLWVADRTNNRIEKFTGAGEFLLAAGKEVDATTKANICTAASGDTCQAGAFGSGEGQFNRPSSLTVDSKGNVWVLDSENSRVEKFTESGEYLSKFGSCCSGNGKLNEDPEGIAVDAKGHIWVADTLNNRIEEFSESGEFLKTVGSLGASGGQFSHPTSIAIGPTGNLWVADRTNNRIEKFTEAGEFLLAQGKEVNATTGADLCTAASGNTCQAAKEAAGEGQFKHPGGIEVDPKSHVWVIDEGNERVEELSEGARFIGQFGSPGSGEGQFSFGSGGNGIAADSNGDLWVGDYGNNRVQEWGY